MLCGNAGWPGWFQPETLHIDAGLIGAKVSMDALVTQHLDTVEAADADADAAVRDARMSGRFRKPCRTDPDATMATSSKALLRPICKQRRAVDELAGVVADMEIVTGEEQDSGRFEERLDTIETTPGTASGRITADMLYGTGRIFAALEERHIAVYCVQTLPSP